MTEVSTLNIAFAGLTAAGKTTHARHLAADLGYDYVSATDILFGLLGLGDQGANPWFTALKAINAARDGDAVDDELEAQLAGLAASRDRTVFDSWALAWICPVPIVRIWIESDLTSRTRKCQVSLGEDVRVPCPSAKGYCALRTATTDLATLDRYLSTLRDLQRNGMRVSIHLGELFGPAFSRQVLSRIVPSRIGHGVLLLRDPGITRLIAENDICLDMCPVSNTRLGVHDWSLSSPAAEAMRLGLNVTVNTDDPLLFGAGLAENLTLAGLTRDQLETARLTASKYGCRR